MKVSPVILLLPLISFLLLVNAGCFNSQAKQSASKETQETYQCVPCGSACDTTTFDKPGECQACHMQLVKKSSVVFKSIEPTAICDYIQQHPSVVLLDVRTKEEFEGKANPDFGTLKNAINLPIQELESKISSISLLKDKEVVVYCSHSRRSPRASYLLTQHGFTNVTNMNGGMSKVSDTACKK